MLIVEAVNCAAFELFWLIQMISLGRICCSSNTSEYSALKVTIINYISSIYFQHCLSCTGCWSLSQLTFERRAEILCIKAFIVHSKRVIVVVHQVIVVIWARWRREKLIWLWRFYNGAHYYQSQFPDFSLSIYITLVYFVEFQLTLLLITTHRKMRQNQQCILVAANLGQHRPPRVKCFSQSAFNA